MMLRQQRTTVRRGLSLLEVIIALAVFLISYIAIYQLMNLATDEAIELTYRNDATHLAQRKLAEIAAGVEGFQSSGDTAFDDPDGDYTWSADVEAGAVESLSIVTVTVSRNFQGGTLQVTASQMMLNPQNIGSTQDVQATPLNSATSGATASPSGSSGTSGTSATPSTSGSSSSTKPATSSTKP